MDTLSKTSERSAHHYLQYMEFYSTERDWLYQEAFNLTAVARRPLWHATHEAVSPNSCVLAQNRRRHHGQSMTCGTCAEHQNAPPKYANHPWMLPEKPWSCVHIDYAINFLGSNWLVMVDAYSKYPCIHPTSSTSTKATTDLLEQDFAHFGFSHTIVSDNATTFKSGEFQAWCQERGITHLTGAPYHPAAKGAAERLVQTFKQALKKSSSPPRQALQEFLMQYRRTPLASGILRVSS